MIDRNDVLVWFQPARLTIFSGHDGWTTVYSDASLGDLRVLTLVEN
jgi:hypothetical protein